MSTLPQPPTLRSGQYDEPATFGDLTALHKYMVENHVRFSLTSPPLLKDLPEGCVVYDKTLNRLYMTVDQTLRYVQFT